MAATRPRPEPPTHGTTLHLVGDVHAGAIAPWRMDSLARDSTSDRMPDPDAVLQLGDTINDQLEYTPIFKHYMNRLGDNWHAVMGNHDVRLQTPQQWADSMGYTAPSRIVDLPDLRIVLWAVSEEWGDGSNYNFASPAKLAWLDTAIGGTTKPVFVACHFPLWDTFRGDPAIDNDSRTYWIYVRTESKPDNSDDVLDVLAAHDNVKAWIAGHSHSRIQVPGLVMPVEHAGKRIASINAGTPWDSWGLAWEDESQIPTLYATWLDDKIEVRFRDHGAGIWDAPNGNRVITVDGLA